MEGGGRCSVLVIWWLGAGLGFAEVGSADGVVAAEFGAGAGDGDLAGFDDVSAVGDFECHEGVLFDEEDGGAFASDFLDGLEDGFDEDGGEAHGGFVEEEEAWARHEGAADGEHLLFAAGEGAAGLAEAFLEAGEEAVDAVEVLLDGVVAGVGAHEEVFVDGEAVEDAAAFGYVGESEADDGVGLEAVDALAGEGDLAGSWADDAGDGAEGGGFAGTVGADEGDDFAFFDVEGDAFDGEDGAVAGVEVADVKEWHGRLSGWRGCRGRLR